MSTFCRLVSKLYQFKILMNNFMKRTVFQQQQKESQIFYFFTGYWKSWYHRN